MKNIDYELLQEQLDFLVSLASDLEAEKISLPSNYSELGATPTEYIDGLCALIDEVFRNREQEVITATDLYESISKTLPNAIFDEDTSGEIIIATGYSFDEDGTTLKKVTKD